MSKLLEFDNITFSAGISGAPVCISGNLEAGSVLNLRGPSGAGKTTLLRILARLREPDQGTVWLKGRSWTDFSPSGWRRKVYYLSQKPVLFDGTVMDNLKKPFELAVVRNDAQFDPDRAGYYMKHLFLPAELLDQDARTISGGEAARLGLVRALLTGQGVLLLDEPLAALDQMAAGAVLKLIAAWLHEDEDRGAVIVSHTGEMEILPHVSVLELKRKAGGHDE